MTLAMNTLRKLHESTHDSLLLDVFKSSIRYNIISNKDSIIHAEDGLLQYLDTFATIGYVLLAIAALIFVLNKPIQGTKFCSRKSISIW